MKSGAASITPAIFGLIGVIVGSLITAGAEWWRERARLGRGRRLAARRMIAQLRGARTRLEEATKAADGAALLQVRGLSAVWADGMADLIDLPHGDWEILDKCSVLFESLEGKTFRDTTLSDRTVRALGQFEHDMTAAIAVLEPHAR